MPSTDILIRIKCIGRERKYIIWTYQFTKIFHQENVLMKAVLAMNSSTLQEVQSPTVVAKSRVQIYHSSEDECKVSLSLDGECSNTQIALIHSQWAVSNCFSGKCWSP